MLRSSQKKFAPTQIGDTVRIQVPDVDRGRTDNRNVLAVVVGIEKSESSIPTTTFLQMKMVPSSSFTHVISS
ncbi:hypothetical protein TNCV_3868091 [Trichonephila clavipes]|nr:hypothetical protein TNCV_3868091 [Trichonephila clavipes]